jgi:hypothetical protein
MTCPECEYHKRRAALWRAEAYKQAGHDVIERPWVGLTDNEIKSLPSWWPSYEDAPALIQLVKDVETKLKEKNMT